MVLNVSTSQEIQVQKEIAYVTEVVLDNPKADLFAWL